MRNISKNTIYFDPVSTGIDKKHKDDILEQKQILKKNIYIITQSRVNFQKYKQTIPKS